MSEVGDNSGSVNAPHLRAFIERIERLTEEKNAIADDIREVYAEAKGNGFDPKIIRKLVAARRKKAEAIKAENELLATYADALGMQETFGF